MATLVDDRIDLRISKEHKELIKYASQLSGFKSVSEFIVFSIYKEANDIIRENNQILKSIEDKKIFLNALINSPAPNARLKKAQLNYNKFIEANGTDYTDSRKRTRKKQL